MIIFEESYIINTTIQELKRQGYACENMGTVIECYKKSNGDKIYWHNEKKVFFQNTLKQSMDKIFKVIVAGGRDFTDYQLLKSKLDHILSNKENIQIVSGVCNTGKLMYNRPDGTAVCGADGLGEKYAAEKGYPVKPFPADWEKFGRSAGMIRNGEMAEYVGSDGGLVAFWDQKSKGTANMIKQAKEKQMKVLVVNY